MNQFSPLKEARNRSCLPIIENQDEKPKYTLSINKAKEATVNGINSGGLIDLFTLVAKTTLHSCNNIKPQDTAEII